MTWVFEECPDEFGSCVRQDILFGLSVLLLLLAAYSCYRVKRQGKGLVYELLPLSINTLTSLFLLGIYTQAEVFNIRVSLLIIELYSYFILTYSFIHLVVQRTAGSQSTFSIIRRLFAVVSAVCLLALIVVSVAGILGLTSCDEDQGLGSIIVVGLELPLLLVTYIYGHKSKSILVQGDQPEYSQTEESKEHLLNQQQQFRKVKLLQLKFIGVGFVTTVILHIAEIALFYVGSSGSEFVCSSQSNEIQVTSALVFTALFIENVTQLLPHFLIPVVFWYMPSRIAKQAASVHLQNGDLQEADNNMPKLKIRRQESKLMNDVQNQQQIRKKLGQSLLRKLQRASTI